MSLSSSPDRDIMAFGDRTGHSEQDVSGGSMVHTLGIYVAFGGNMVIDINTNPGCGRIMDPVMILGSSLARISLWPHGPCSNVACGYQHVSRWQPRLQALAQSLMVSEVTDINIDPKCDRAVGPYFYMV